MRPGRARRGGRCDHLRFPPQAADYAAPFFTGDRELIDLGAVVKGTASGRNDPSDITLHCSVGLAGTEVILAALLLDQNSRE